MASDLEGRILFEDNHLIVLNKLPGELVQGDESGDETLADKVKRYLKETYHKEGNVYLGIPHRLDRPTSGIVIYTKTEKALLRMNEAFKSGDVKKIYWAVVDKLPDKSEGTLVHYITRNAKLNKSAAHPVEEQGSKLAKLDYKVIAKGDRYYLLEIRLHTGRHHQIRAQLAAIGIHIKGDLKYGAARSNPDGGICLHARSVTFTHPVRRQPLMIVAEPPDDNLWNALKAQVKD